MPEADENPPHLSHAEIEAYWKGDLPTSEEERVEEHYVECADCGARVAALETVIDSLRADSLMPAPGAGRLRAWQLAAAVFAALAVGAWLWPRSVRPAELAVRTHPGPVATAIVALAPATRAAAGPLVRLPSDAKFVVFELDVRETNAAAARFEVSLARSTGQVVLRLTDASATDTGILRVPVDMSLLTAGEYVFSATTGSATVAIPFLIRPPDSG